MHELPVKVADVHFVLCMRADKRNDGVIHYLLTIIS